MEEKQYSWYKLADDIRLINFAGNNIAVAEVNGKKICIGRYKNEYFAFAYKCPHAGGILSEGYIDSLGNVVCPVHRYRYAIKNGQNTSGEGYYLKNWLVALREDGVFIRMEENSGFWNFFH